MAELRRLPPSQEGVEVLNLKARILRAVGRLEAAVSTFEASLSRRADQPEILRALAELRLEQGEREEARALWSSARALGDAAADLALIRLDLRPDPQGWPLLSDLSQIGKLWRLEERLSALFEEERYGPEARVLNQELRERLRSLYLLLGGGLLLSLLLLLGLRLNRRARPAVDLLSLLSAHPEAGPDIQRILSAIRHEVLKHNTMVLEGLIKALEEEHPEAQAKALWARRSLLGPPGSSGGARRRLLRYVEELLQIARRYDLRLEPHRRDPALSALLSGFKELSRIAPLLDRAHRLGARRRERLLRALKRAESLLNAQGYEAIRALLDHLRILQVDEALILNLFERTAGEPAFAEESVASLEISGELPCTLTLPQGAFEDILSNLIRNALQSMLREGVSLRLGLEVEEEFDPITGLARAVFSVKDSSPALLSLEQLRGRGIEAGLGIVSELLSRYEGSLDICPLEAPWSKAVQVKLPMMEEVECW